LAQWKLAHLLCTTIQSSESERTVTIQKMLMRLCRYSGQPPWLCFFLHVTVLASIIVGLQGEQCELAGNSALPASNLLQMGSSIDEHRWDAFGPGLCVGVRRNEAGSCVIRTRCMGRNISQTDFSFVCFNPSATVPQAMHTFGRGGFADEEHFDTRIYCKTCMSVDTAFRTGDSVVKNALAALPLSQLPGVSSALQNGPAYSAAELKEFMPKDAAVFGPDYCISTFRAPTGTCLLRTRCANVDLSKFNVGVTCLDKSGGYTRYLFGKDVFKEEETFDTLVSCEKCLGVGPESSIFALHGLLPKKMVDDVGTLKMDVQTLNEQVRVLQQYSAAQQEDSIAHHHDANPHDGSHLTQEGDSVVPTVMMARRKAESAAALPGVPGSVATSDTGYLEQAGAEMASIDEGPVQMISHRRGATLAELLRRVST
jgi:hypothetical protein